MTRQPLTVPPGTRLLHIGPFKTGTTALQGAFHQAREQLAEHGIVYAGKGRQPLHAAAWVTGAKGLLGSIEPTIDHWEALCSEVSAAGDRNVVVSSEYFSNGDEQAARTVAEGLGGPRVHVVVTLRSLMRVIPSQWQQYVQSGLRTPYGRWLDGMLRKPPYDKPTPTFWKRHRHDRLVERWAGVVGLDNLTVVVVDDSDPMMQFRTFEELIGLPDGILKPEYDLANRSLTLAEVQLLRELNKEVFKEDWPHASYRKYIRDGVVHNMKVSRIPSKDEPRIITPKWAIELIAELSAEFVENITKSGVRIVGDISSLVDCSSSEPAGRSETMPTSVATAAVLGGIRPHLPTKEPSVLDRPVRHVDARTLLKALANRGLRRLRRRSRRRSH